MELQINDRSIESGFDSAMTIGEVVGSITAELREETRVICQIIIDDEIIHEDGEEEAFNREVASVKSLRVMADTVEGLVQGGLKSLHGLIPELVRVLSGAADSFRVGETKRAQDLFASSLEGLEIVPTILDGVRATMHLDFSKLNSGENSLGELEQRMLGATRSIFEAQKGGDFVLLADLVEYELIPNLNLWFHAIPVLDEACQERVSNK